MASKEEVKVDALVNQIQILGDKLHKLTVEPDSPQNVDIHESISEEITIKEFNGLKNHVIIPLPTIYLDITTPVSADKTIINYRVISVPKFKEVLDYMRQNERLNGGDFVPFTKKLIQYIGKSFNEETDKNNQIMQPLLSSISLIAEIVDEVALEELFVDIDTESINFDSIRKYSNDPSHHILNDFEQSTYNGCVLYSQLDKASQLDCRRLNNDTNLNRNYYELWRYTDTLTFQEGRIYDNSPRYLNLFLLFLYLAKVSRPLKNKSTNDLSDHYSALILDAAIRTRIIGAWRYCKLSKLLLQDMVTNYTNSVMVDICKKTSAQERFDYIVKCITASGAYNLSYLKYSTYLSTLNEFAITINDKTYYKLNSIFLLKVCSMINIQSFSNKESSDLLLSSFKRKNTNDITDSQSKKARH